MLSAFVTDVKLDVVMLEPLPMILRGIISVIAETKIIAAHC